MYIEGPAPRDRAAVRGARAHQTPCPARVRARTAYMAGHACAILAAPTLTATLATATNIRATAHPQLATFRARTASTAHTVGSPMVRHPHNWHGILRHNTADAALPELPGTDLRRAAHLPTLAGGSNKVPANPAGHNQGIGCRGARRRPRAAKACTRLPWPCPNPESRKREAGTVAAMAPPHGLATR